METSFPTMLTNVFFLVPQIITGVACIYYLTHKATNDAILLAAGSIIGFLVSCFYTFGLPFLISTNLMDHFSGYETLIQFTRILSFISSILFAIGLLLLITRIVNKK